MAWCSALRCARFTHPLIGSLFNAADCLLGSPFNSADCLLSSPFNSADCWIGSPVASKSTGLVAPRVQRLALADPDPPQLPQPNTRFSARPHGFNLVLASTLASRWVGPVQCNAI